VQLSFMYLPNIFYALKYGRDPEKVIEYFEKILIFASGNTPKELAVNFFNATLIYLQNVSTLKSEIMIQLLEKLPPTERIQGITTYQQFINKGREESREEGREEGRIELMESTISTLILKLPDFSDIQIAELSGFSVEAVRRVRLSLN
jgi:predicted transposase YdaD